MNEKNHSIEEKNISSMKVTHNGKKVIIDVNGSQITAGSLRIARTTAKEITNYNNNLSSYYLRDVQEADASFETAKQLNDERVRKQYDELRRQLELD